MRQYQTHFIVLYSDLDSGSVHLYSYMLVLGWKSSYPRATCKDVIMHLHVRFVVATWNLSKTATCGPVLTDLYRELAALQR